MSYATLTRGYGAGAPFRYSYSSPRIPSDFLKTDIIGTDFSTVDDRPVCQCLDRKKDCNEREDCVWLREGEPIFLEGPYESRWVRGGKRCVPKARHDCDDCSMYKGFFPCLWASTVPCRGICTWEEDPQGFLNGGKCTVNPDLCMPMLGFD